MLKILVAVDRSLESSFALRTACLFGPQNLIKPIYILEPPTRDMTLGAGWARKSWERETSRQAQVDIDDLVVADRIQCPNIENPLVLTGDLVQEVSRVFWEEAFDFLMLGVPFRGWGGWALSHRLHQAARKAKKDIPLLTVRRFKQIEKVVALTDGSGPAESALGLMAGLSSFIQQDLTLVGLSREHDSGSDSESLHLERGLAILKEKGLEAEGWLASDLGPEELARVLKSFDLVVKPVLKGDRYSYLRELLDEEVQAVLFYVGKD